MGGARGWGFNRENAHGDVVQLTYTNGNVEKYYDYDAFGNELNPAQYDPNPFRYCGEYHDDETGTIYLRARHYDPRIGRFTSQDPINHGLNWYTYANNNPVMFVDPTGHMAAKRSGGAPILSKSGDKGMEVLLDPIVQKNGGSATYNRSLDPVFSITGITVEMNGVSKTYTSNDYRLADGYYFIGNRTLMRDFGLSSTQSTHQPGDTFRTADEAALAFGLMTNGRSIAENREYAAFIYKGIYGGYYYDHVITGTWNYAGITLPESMQICVAFVHTHAAYMGRGGEDFTEGRFIFSDVGYSNLFGINCYLATPSGALFKYTYTPTRAIQRAFANQNNANVSLLATGLPRDPKSKVNY